MYGELVSSQSPEFDYWNAINWTTSFKTLPDPYLLIDGGANPGKGYQSCCSSGPLMGITIALKLYPGALAIPSNLDFIEYASRWIVSGALTQPDVCAPATGRCLNGSTLGAACNTANREIVCGSTSQCLIDMSGSGGYGITFGPDGNGYCILDADPSDGIGRFPQNNGISASTGSFYSTFQKNIMLAYWPTLSQ